MSWWKFFHQLTKMYIKMKMGKPCLVKTFIKEQTYFFGMYCFELCLVCVWNNACVYQTIILLLVFETLIIIRYSFFIFFFRDLIFFLASFFKYTSGAVFGLLVGVFDLLIQGRTESNCDINSGLWDGSQTQI